MESNEWMSLVMGIAVWVWDAIRAAWNALTWRDVLPLLILLGLWAGLRDLGRVLWRVRQLHEKVDEREDFSRVYKRLQDLDDKFTQFKGSWCEVGSRELEQNAPASASLRPGALRKCNPQGGMSNVENAPVCKAYRIHATRLTLGTFSMIVSIGKRKLITAAGLGMVPAWRIGP